MRALTKLTILALGLSLVACKNPGPYSLEDALEKEIPLPIYAPNPDMETQYAGLDVQYYYYDGHDEFRLDAFFTDGSTESNRVAKLSICTICTLIGQPSEAMPGEIPVILSQDGVALICKPSSNMKEPVSGEPYKSCLFWIDESLYKYKLYTIWDVQTSALFANSLLRLQKPDDH